jgi:hypothetical protein
MARPAETTAVVRPWYRQFYVRRGDAEWRSDEISDDGCERGLEAIGGFVYVGTAMYGSPTELAVRVHTSEPRPPESAERTAQVTVGGDGDLQILNWEHGEDPVAVVAVPVGPVVLRVGWSGTSAAVGHPDYEVGGDSLSPERLVLDVWPLR